MTDNAAKPNLRVINDPLLANVVKDSLEWENWDKEFSEALVLVTRFAILQSGKRSPSLQMAINALKNVVSTYEK